MAFIRSYTTPQLVSQAEGWNPTYPVLGKVSSAFFFGDGIRPYQNLPWLDSGYSASVGTATMSVENNNLGKLIRKTAGGYTRLFTGNMGPGYTSSAMLFSIQNGSTGLYGSAGRIWRLSGSATLQADFSSGIRGTGSTTLSANTSYVVSTDNDTSATKCYLNGGLEFSFSGWGSMASIAELGSVDAASGTDWPGLGVQVVLGFNQTLTAAEHKIIADLLLRDPMDLFKPLAKTLWFPISAGGSPYSIACATGSFTLTGNATGLKASRNIVTSVRSFTHSGNSIGIAVGRKILAGTGSFSLTGPPSGLTYTPASGPTFTITGVSRSFLFIGNVSNLTASRRIISNQASFSFIGNTTNLKASRTLPSSFGTFTLTGNSALFNISRKISANTTSFSLTRNPANLVYTPTGGATYTIPATTASFTLTGNSANLIASRKIQLSVGTFTLNGISNTFLLQRKIVLSTGTFTLSGISANFKCSRYIGLSTGTFTLTGNSVTLTAGSAFAYSKYNRTIIDVGGVIIMLGNSGLDSWGTATRPSFPKKGTAGYNLQLSKIEIYDGSTWKSVAVV